MTEATHFVKVLIGMDAPRSQVTAAERALLCEHARNSRVVVEIGCFEGATAAELARSAGGDVYSIDAFPRGRAGVSFSEWIAHLERLKGWARGRSSAYILRGTSEEVACDFDLPIDLLFIDADHSYDGVRRDWEMWEPKVRAGGTIALHDCRQTPHHPHYLGSARFYEEDLVGRPGFEELPGVESLAFFRKTPAVPPLTNIEIQVNPIYIPGKAA